MSKAVEKTKAHSRVFLPIGDLVPNEENPNKMNDAEFNMLYDNMESMGITDPLLVRKLDDGKFRVVGGHHRLEIAKLLDFEEVPCTVIEDDKFDDDQERFQLVRMNVIHGKMSPEKFLNMYEKLSKKYSHDILQDSFGFADEKEFDALVQQAAKSLPPELQSKFKEAAKEVQTIDGLANILNQMFAEHGDTLPFGYMVFDFGGQNSIWLRMDKNVYVLMNKLGEFCKENNRVMDTVMGELLKAVVNDEDTMTELLEVTPERVIPDKVETPTLDFLDKYSTDG